MSWKQGIPPCAITPDAHVQWRNTDVYRSLDLLQDVSIAEEARDNIKTGGSIFNDIVPSPVRYAIMDDYTKTVNLEEPKAGVFLNGDTEVRSALDTRRGAVALLAAPGRPAHHKQEPSCPQRSLRR